MALSSHTSLGNERNTYRDRNRERRGGGSVQTVWSSPAAEEGKKLRKARKCVSHCLCVRESGRITQTWNESMFDSNIGGFSWRLGNWVSARQVSCSNKTRSRLLTIMPLCFSLVLMSSCSGERWVISCNLGVGRYFIR